MALLSTGVRRLDAAVVLCHRLWQTAGEISITVGATCSVLECVIERGEILEPPLDSCDAVPNFSDIFLILVIRKKTELRAPR